MNCVAFKPDNPNIVVSASDDNTIKTWDITGTSTMDCFEAPRMGLNLFFIKVSAAPTGALGPWKVEEP